jgi:hypothetical protein
MNRFSVCAVLAACLLLAGCGGDPERARGMPATPLGDTQSLNRSTGTDTGSASPLHSDDLDRRTTPSRDDVAPALPTLTLPSLPVPRGTP